MISIPFFRRIACRLAVPRLAIIAAGLMLTCTQAIAVDTDLDGVEDNLDNCIEAPNGPLILDAGGNSQLDTNDDGYGNICDGDLNNDGDTNTLDLNLYRLAHRTEPGDPNYNPDADFNGDGPVNSLDLIIYNQDLHRQPPGPSCIDLPGGCI